MNRYGQTITWSTIAAPHLFTGHCTAYSYADAATRQPMDDEAGDNVAIALHSRKADLNFSAEITSQSTDFLDLSTGAAIVVDGLANTVLVSRAVETWRLGQRKTASITATHYPDMVQADPDLAGVELDAVTPAAQAQAFVFPGGVLIYGTAGLGHASGVVHALTIEQQLTITEDDPSPAGTILGAASHGYMRTIKLELLATGAIPAVKSVLALTGAPAHAADYRIERAEQIFASKRGKMFSIDAVWIPPFTT